MITQTGMRKKLSKCMVVGIAALTLNGCVSLKQLDQDTICKEVPHLKEVSLNAKLVRAQKPIDEDFLRQENEMLNEICFSELFDLKSHAVSHADQSALAVQKLDDYCQAMKVMTQRVASQYKRMENATKQKYKISGYEVLGINNDIWSYHSTEVIKTTVNGVRVRNQDISEDTDINAVRAALQHRMHRFLDAKTLALTGALSNEVAAMEKYELGYGILDNYCFTANKQQNFEEQIYHITEAAMEDIVNYAMYEYQHDPKIQDPAHLEAELQHLFDQLEKGLNAYGYQGQGSEKDLSMANQANQQLVTMLPQAMFGSEKEIKALLGEISSSLSLLPLSRSLSKHGVDLSKRNTTAVVHPETEIENVR